MSALRTGRGVRMRCRRVPRSHRWNAERVASFSVPHIGTDAHKSKHKDKFLHRAGWRRWPMPSPSPSHRWCQVCSGFQQSRLCPHSQLLPSYQGTPLCIHHSPHVFVALRSPAVTVAAKAATGKRKLADVDGSGTDGGGRDVADGVGPGAPKRQKVGEADSGALRPVPVARPEQKPKKLTPKDAPEKVARTVFVGNVPLALTAKKLASAIQKLLNAAAPAEVASPAAAAAAAGTTARPAKKGTSAVSTAAEPASDAVSATVDGLTRDIESVRFRSVPVSATAVTPGADYHAMVKAAVIQNKLDADSGRDSMNGACNCVAGPVQRD
jgi:hypothetical protein